MMKNQTLSGSDYFHLLLDRKMLRNGLVGNISRIHLELESNADLSQLQEKLSQNKTLLEVANLRYVQRWPMLPRWEVRDCYRTGSSSFAMTPDPLSLRGTKQSLRIHKNLSQTQFETSVLNRKVNNETGLVFIDLCELEDDSKHVVISMHHVLFDHQGMMNFVQALADESASFPLFPKPEPSNNWKVFLNFWWMTVYMLKRANWKLGVLVDKRLKPKAHPQFKVIQFSEEETEKIEKRAWQTGAKIGRSPFYAAATAKLVLNVLQKRGQKPPYLWFSVPHDLRKKGTKGHLVSNQLSFLFFRLNSRELETLSTSVASVNQQIRAQIKAQIVDRYANLLHAMRCIPLGIYEAMVDLASGGKMSSFSFSDLGENKLQCSTFQGYKVVEAINYPPVPSPPGFNVVVSKEAGKLKFVWAYFDEVITPKELTAMKVELRRQLLL